MKNLNLFQPIVDINTVSVFNYNDMDTYRQERLYNLRPDCIADFNKQNLEFIQEQYQKNGVTSGRVEVEISLGDGMGAIIYGNYKLEDLFDWY